MWKLAGETKSCKILLAVSRKAIIPKWLQWNPPMAQWFEIVQVVCNILHVIRHIVNVYVTDIYIHFGGNGLWSQLKKILWQKPLQLIYLNVRKHIYCNIALKCMMHDVGSNWPDESSVCHLFFISLFFIVLVLKRREAKIKQQKQVSWRTFSNIFNWTKM